MSIKILLIIAVILTGALVGVYFIRSESDAGTSAAAIVQKPVIPAEPVKKQLTCEPRLKPVNGVCVPEVRYLSGFSYADCDQKYTWSKALNAYVNEKRDRALVVKDKNLVCHPMKDGKIESGNFGTRVLDVEVVFDEHPQTEIPEGTSKMLSGFRYANCDGHYRWSVEKKAFINDEGNRAVTLDGPKLMCRDFKDGKMGGSFGTRLSGAKGVTWMDPKN